MGRGQFCLRQRLQAGIGAYSASCSAGYRLLFPRG
jgi:hypothetical protein